MCAHPPRRLSFRHCVNLISCPLTYLPSPFPLGTAQLFLGRRYQAGFKFMTGCLVSQSFRHLRGAFFCEGSTPWEDRSGSVPGAVEPGPGDSSWDGPVKQSSGGRGTEGVTRTVPRVCKIRPRTRQRARKCHRKQKCPGGHPRSWGQLVGSSHPWRGLGSCPVCDAHLLISFLSRRTHLGSVEKQTALSPLDASCHQW